MFSTLEIACRSGHFLKVLNQNQLDFRKLCENCRTYGLHQIFAMASSSKGKFDFWVRLRKVCKKHPMLHQKGQKWPFSSNFPRIAFWKSATCANLFQWSFFHTWSNETCSIKVSSHLNIICRSLEVKSAPKKDEIWLQVALLTLKEPGKLSRLFGTFFLIF